MLFSHFQASNRSTSPVLLEVSFKSLADSTRILRKYSPNGLQYFRYLYPVDKNRIDMSGMIEETPDEVSDQVPAKETGVVKEKKE